MDRKPATIWLEPMYDPEAIALKGIGTKLFTSPRGRSASDVGGAAEAAFDIVSESRPFITLLRLGPPNRSTSRFAGAEGAKLHRCHALLSQSGLVKERSSPRRSSRKRAQPSLKFYTWRFPAPPPACCPTWRGRRIVSPRDSVRARSPGSSPSRVTSARPNWYRRPP